MRHLVALLLLDALGIHAMSNSNTAIVMANSSTTNCRPGEWKGLVASWAGLHLPATSIHTDKDCQQNTVMFKPESGVLHAACTGSGAATV